MPGFHISYLVPIRHIIKINYAKIQISTSMKINKIKFEKIKIEQLIILSLLATIIWLSAYVIITYSGIFLGLRTVPNSLATRVYEEFNSSKSVLDKTEINIEDIIIHTNNYRKEKGLAPLKQNSKLNLAAQNKAKHAMENDYWAHFAPDHTTPWSFIVSADYQYTFAGENLARGIYGSKEVVDSWIKSPEHEKNLLSDKYTEIGIGILEGRLSGEETIIVVQMFAAPMMEQGNGAKNSNNYEPPVLNLNEIKNYLQNIQSSRQSWVGAKGYVNDSDLTLLLDSFDRQIIFSETLVSKLESGQSPSPDDVNLWNSVIKMGVESSELSKKLNARN